MKWWPILWVLMSLTAWAICTTVPPKPTPPPLPPETNSTESATTVFPLEVLGEPGHIESFSVNIPSGSTADTLYLQIFGLGYEGKASVRMNSGTWLTLTDTNVTYPRLENSFFGMGGALETLRMTVPTSAWTPVNGSNTFEFRFNDADGLTIGYRVLDLQLRNGSTDLIPTNNLVYDDPSTWTPISTNAADINSGSNAWFTLSITERGTNIVAKCTDCHARDGRDLKYFNYSDKSIIKRSIFHGVDPAVATNIASYIRNLNVPYETNARPWNPPYQPGPGIDLLPIRSWAAGMGLEWVQEDDTNVLSYIFPSGITTNALNLTNILNAREIPLGIQLPSWNKWLPKFHPFDQDPVWYATNEYTTIYTTIRSDMASLSGVAAATYFRKKASPWDDASTPAPLTKPSKSDPYYATWAAYERDRRHWRAVKTWEIMTEWAIEDYGDEESIFPAVPSGSALNERRWFHGEIFRLGPHVIGTPKTESFDGESTQWYQLQLVLNDGNRRNGSIVPIDWGYQHALNQSTWDNPTNFVTYGILVLNIIKGSEVGVNGYGLTNSNALDPLKADTYRLASQYLGSRYALIPETLRKAVAEAVIIPWLEYCESFTKDEYNAEGWLSGTRGNNWSNRLGYHLTWFPTINMDTNIVNRIGTLKTNLFH